MAVVNNANIDFSFSLELVIIVKPLKNHNNNKNSCPINLGSKISAATKKNFFFLGHVNDLHTWQFLTGRPTGRPTSLDKIKSPDCSKVGMLYRQGGH